MLALCLGSLHGAAMHNRQIHKGTWANYVVMTEYGEKEGDVREKEKNETWTFWRKFSTASTASINNSNNESTLGVGSRGDDGDEREGMSARERCNRYFEMGWNKLARVAQKFAGYEYTKLMRPVKPGLNADPAPLDHLEYNTNADEMEDEDKMIPCFTPKKRKDRLRELHAIESRTTLGEALIVDEEACAENAPSILELAYHTNSGHTNKDQYGTDASDETRSKSFLKWWRKKKKEQKESNQPELKNRHFTFVDYSRKNSFGDDSILTEKDLNDTNNKIVGIFKTVGHNANHLQAGITYSDTGLPFTSSIPTITSTPNSETSSAMRLNTSGGGNPIVTRSTDSGNKKNDCVSGVDHHQRSWIFPILLPKIKCQQEQECRGDLGSSVGNDESDLPFRFSSSELTKNSSSSYLHNHSSSSSFQSDGCSILRSLLGWPLWSTLRQPEGVGTPLLSEATASTHFHPDVLLETANKVSLSVTSSLSPPCSLSSSATASFPSSASPPPPPQVLRHLEMRVWRYESDFLRFLDQTKKWALDLFVPDEGVFLRSTICTTVVDDSNVRLIE